MLKLFFLSSIFLAINLFAQNGIIKSYYGKGKVSSLVSFVNDVLEGESIWYYENGNIKTIKNYSNGKLDNSNKSFYESGLLKEEIHYSDGVLNGISKFYYENGGLKEVRTYNNGKLISISNVDYDSNYAAPFSAYEAGINKKNYNNEDILCDAEICPQPIGGIKEIEKNIVYPELAKKFNLEGKVLVSVIVGANGEAKNITVHKGLGLGCDEAAIDAVKKTKFIPGEKNGEVTETEILFSLNFKLSENNETKFVTSNEVKTEEIKQVPEKKQFIICDYDVCPKPVGGINEMLKKLKYPAQAKRNEISGEVEVEAKINDLGFVISVNVLKGIGYGCDEAAKSVIIKSEFEPAIENGKVVESTVKIIIPFILEN
ncbi:MAG: TonB family protein [Ignavibacteriae bacterium]|nr:TonB family protein [Ignavibacteriota bacterium]